MTLRPVARLDTDGRTSGFCDSLCAQRTHYMVQPLAELYGGCMAVLKVS